MIKQTARRRDQNLYTLAEGGVLVGKADAADEKRHRPFVIGAEFFKGIGDLGGQLARWRQDQ